VVSGTVVVVVVSGTVVVVVVSGNVVKSEVWLLNNNKENAVRITKNKKENVYLLFIVWENLYSNTKNKNTEDVNH
jgi:hypothetical protein